MNLSGTGTGTGDFMRWSQRQALLPGESRASSADQYSFDNNLLHIKHIFICKYLFYKNRYLYINKCDVQNKENVYSRPFRINFVGLIS